jgi:hypothetical protein
VLNVTDPTNPVEEGKVRIGQIFEKVVVYDGGLLHAPHFYACILTRSGGFIVVDLGSPAKPLIVGTFSLKGYSTQIAMYGRYAIIDSSRSALAMVDLSKPATPVLAALYKLPNNASVYDISVEGSFASIASGSDGVIVLDISDPLKPVLHMKSDNLMPCAIEKVAMSYPFVYGLIADPMHFCGDSYFVFNMTDSLKPILSKGSTMGGSCIAVRGDTVYSGSSVLQATSFRDFKNPVTLGSIGLNGASENLCYFQKYLYSAQSRGLDIFDVSNPSKIVRIGSFETIGIMTDLAVEGDSVYIADQLSGIFMYNFANPQVPVRTAWCTRLRYGDQIAAANGALYFDRNDPYNPAGSMLFGYDWNQGGLSAGDSIFQSREIAVAGKAVCVAEHSRFSIHNFSNTSAPYSSLIRNAPAKYGCQSVAISDKKAFFSVSSDSSIFVYDISQPALPRLLSTINLHIGVQKCAISGNYLYALDGTDLIRIINISNLNAPTTAGYFTIPDTSIEEMEISGKYAVILTNPRGTGSISSQAVHILDISVPGAPFRMLSFPTFPNSIRTCKLAGNRLFAVYYDAGLQVYDFIPPTSAHESRSTPFLNRSMTGVKNGSVYFPVEKSGRF